MLSIRKYLWLLPVIVIAFMGIKIYQMQTNISSLESKINQMALAKVKADKELQNLKADKDKIVVQEVIKYKDKIVHVEKVKTVERIKQNAVEINSGCVISAAFVSMHDDIVRARNKDSEGTNAGGVEGETKTSSDNRTYECSAVLEVIDENYKRFQENRVLLEATQDAWTKAGE